MLLEKLLPPERLGGDVDLDGIAQQTEVRRLAYIDIDRIKMYLFSLCSAVSR